MFPLFKTIVCISYKKHLLISLIIRLILISYGIYHDQLSEVKYTDIDYKVFTDASRHILNGNSPYDRHTFRYSPLIAIFLIPNLTIHHSFGKVIFSLVDIIVGLLIRIIVKYNLKEYDCYKLRYSKRLSIRGKSQLIKTNQKYYRQMNKKMKKSKKHGMNIMDTDLLSEDDADINANIAMIFWLYNPLTIAIGTRGNCDSIAGFLVLLSLYFLQCRQYPFFAGLIHGVSIHFRLYPIMYSLTFFMFLSKYSFYSLEDRKEKCLVENTPGKQLKNVNMIPTSSLTDNEIVADGGNTVNRKTIFRMEYLLYLVPNSDQLKLIFGCISSLFFLTWVFYQLFGYKFLFETYVYHLVRKDTRHNFSLFFYLQYLTAWVKNIGIWQKVLTVLPQIILILVFSVRYGLNRFSLNFSILAQTIVMVIYNSVLTSQYFVWIMTILPLCMWQIKMSIKMALFLLFIWFVTQGAWLLPAYLLEFQGQNTFFFIWIQSVSFFCANIAILGRLIMYFMPRKEKTC